MIPRYSHPLVTELWSDQWTYGSWLKIEALTLDVQRILQVVPDEQTADLSKWLNMCHINEEAAGRIRAIERNETHHDVAAFLEYLRDGRGSKDGKWIHYGLTSSDLVDTTQAMRFKELHRPLMNVVGDLIAALGVWTMTDHPTLGYTHGQPGEPTSVRARAFGWLAEIEHPIAVVLRATRAMTQMKLSGPMGTFAHNPPEVEAQVAMALDLRPMGPGATQILPRSPLALWASSCAVLLAAYSKVASDMRLWAARGEVYWKRGDGHVGSSSMPHKNNPIEAEQIRGMARLARGYAAMLEADPLWLERDISHSSVERIAVPDLWHVVFHATRQLTWVLDRGDFNPSIARINLMDNANAAWSAKETLLAIADGHDYDEARELGREVQVESYDIVGDARWFLRQYPKGKQG